MGAAWTAVPAHVVTHEQTAASAMLSLKRTLSPRIGRGLLSACADVKATCRFYVIPSGEDRPMGHDTEGLVLTRLVSELKGLF